MKKITIFIFVCVLINPGFTFGASPTAVCPTGFKEIIEDGLFFSSGQSYLGTFPTNIDVSMCYTGGGFATPCYVSTNTTGSFSDSYGTYSYTTPCPYTTGTTPVLPGVSGTETGIKKCIRLTNTTSCTKNSTGTLDVEWHATCASSVPISGVGVCGSNTGSIGNARTSINVSPTVTNNYNCWCRMIIPAVSRWIYMYNFGGDNEACQNSCADYCATHLGQSGYVSRFNTPMFSVLE